MAPTGSDDTRIPRVDYEFHCDEAGDTEYLVHRMYFVEELNRPYELRVELATEVVEADLEALLAAKCEFVIRRDDHDRSVYGIISGYDFLGYSEDRLLVAVTIVPAFALLRQQTHSRIFQEMTVLDIVQEVLDAELGPYGRTIDLGTSARGTDVRDYCVQYSESDFDFISRLLEEEGISYRFEHSTDDGHEVLTLMYENDDYGELLNIDGTPIIPIAASRSASADRESLFSFDHSRRLTTTSAWRRDFDFTTPLFPLDSKSDNTDERGYDRRIYTHMRRRYTLDADDGEITNTDQLEAAQMNKSVVYAQSDVIQMEAGKTFELERHPISDLEKSYVVMRVVHNGEAPEVLVSGVGSGTRYENRLECVPIDVPIRPPQRTRKPKVYGPQTGIVSGPGEEIHTDEHGRIMVQMHWEEESTYDDTSSCWMRVAQSWAGPGWGAQFIPRVGMEVVVSFLEGNPDRPLVTGCVYNGDNAYPFTLPDNKTQSGWRTDTVSGDGHNMLRFEDAAGAEEIYIHAQKDKNIKILNNRTTVIDNNDTLTVGVDRAKEVGGSQSESVGSNKAINVGGDHTESVGGAQKVSVTGNASFSVGGNNSISVTGSQDLTISGSSKSLTTAISDEGVGGWKKVSVAGLFSESVGASKSITAVGALTLTAGLAARLQCAKNLTINTQKNLLLKADGEMSVTAGKKAAYDFKDEVSVNGDKKAELQVKDEITVKCGSGSVVIKKNGDITIKGKKITIQGSGDVVVKGSKIGLN